MKNTSLGTITGDHELHVRQVRHRLDRDVDPLDRYQARGDKDDRRRRGRAAERAEVSEVEAHRLDRPSVFAIARRCSAPNRAAYHATFGRRPQGQALPREDVAAGAIAVLGLRRGAATRREPVRDDASQRGRGARRDAERGRMYGGSSAPGECSSDGASAI